MAWLSFSVFDGLSNLKIDKRTQGSWWESFVLFPSPSWPWRNVVRSRGMFSAFSVVVSLSLCQTARYWTFHARERIFDFASQRLTYRYPDFLERFRQVNADNVVAHDFVVSRLQAAMCMCIGSVHVPKLWQFRLKFEVKARAEMCEWKERYFLLRAKVVQSSCGSDERCTQHA